MNLKKVLFHKATKKDFIICAVMLVLGFCFLLGDYFVLTSKQESQQAEENAKNSLKMLESIYACEPTADNLLPLLYAYVEADSPALLQYIDDLFAFQDDADFITFRTATDPSSTVSFMQVKANMLSEALLLYAKADDLDNYLKTVRQYIPRLYGPYKFSGFYYAYMWSNGAGEFGVQNQDAIAEVLWQLYEEEPDNFERVIYLEMLSMRHGCGPNILTEVEQYKEIEAIQAQLIEREPLSEEESKIMEILTAKAYFGSMWSSMLLTTEREIPEDFVIASYTLPKADLINLGSIKASDNEAA